MLRFLFLFLLLTCFNTFTFADDKAENKDADKYIPLVYDKENTADIYPRIQMKAFEELPSIPELPDPLAWADGSVRSTDFMDWERHRSEIMQMLYHYEIGEKLPSIAALAKDLNLSPNTIRTAFQNLAKEGYLVFSRGRYGGTFVIDIPEVEEQAFKWLSVNPSFAKEYQKVEEN